MQPRSISIIVCILVLAAVWDVAAQADLQDGLVAYFQLNEESGTVTADASGNGNDGTLVGQGLEWLPGYDGGALNCLGTDTGARVEFPTTGMSAQTGTISLWGYLNAPQPLQTRFFFGHTTHPRWGNRIQICLRGGDGLDVGLGATRDLAVDVLVVPKEKWLHVAVTWDNGTYAVYVDGAQMAKGTYVGLTSLDPMAQLCNDGSTTAYEAFGGRLDEVRIYNRALSAAEVTQVHQVSAVPRLKAWDPSPADGARDVTAALFTWKSLSAIKLHNVYLGTDPNLTAADLVGERVTENRYFHVPPLVPGTLYYWRVDGVEMDLTTMHTGDVWSFLAQPPTAYDPIPAEGAYTVSPATELRWRAGTAAFEHHVYFGADANAVAQGIDETDKGIFKDPNYSPGTLEPGVTYYWRVDEIGITDVVRTGAVWSFTTVVPVDDFESYNDEEGKGTRLYETWLDGATNGSGSTVGYWDPPFAERTIVHGGAQSMPLDYNNVAAPFYSEAERTWATAQDWTAKGTDTLVLYVRGKGTNKAAPVYVTLKDATDGVGARLYPYTVAMSTEWVEWKIALTEFAGVNAARIKTMVIGVGDRANDVAGTTGVLYIDDIGLARTPPANP